MWYLLGVALALGVVGLTHWVHKWRNPKCNGVLPPGSMGLPLIGETFQFFAASKSIDVSAFVKTRINKYGQVFKTNLAGRPVVVSADSAVNHYMLQEEGRLTELWYMDSFAKILGLSESAQPGAAPTNSVGHIHKVTKNLILTKIGINKLKEDYLFHMENASIKALNAWASSPTASINVKEAFAAMVFDLNASILFGYEPEKSEDKNMSERLSSIIPGLMSLPLNIPGTAFRKSMQNQKVLLKIMKNLLDKRLASPEKRMDDLLDLFIDGMTTESFVTHDFIIYAMFSLLFGSYETVSTVVCLLMTYLSDHPEVVKELEKEQEEIIRKRKEGENILSWKEYKSMTFTMHVVNETLRMTNGIPGLLRRATQDIHVNGYTIPKGWAILVLVSTLHMDPETYKDPLSFNPWRWKELDPSVVAKNFMPFGWGMRTCVGAEYAKSIMAVFLHVLVKNYTWQKVKGGEISRAPVLLFGDDGFHIKVFKKINTL